MSRAQQRKIPFDERCYGCNGTGRITISRTPTRKTRQCMVCNGNGKKRRLDCATTRCPNNVQAACLFVGKWINCATRS